MGFLNALFSGRSIFEAPKIEGILGTAFFQQRIIPHMALCPHSVYSLPDLVECPVCLCCVFLYFNTSFFILFKFISGILAALSAMISLEIPQINVMTKMDLLSKKAKKEIEK